MTQATAPASGAKPFCGSRDDLQTMAGAVPFWWHSIDLGEGVVTRGFKTPGILAAELEALRLPDLRGKSVLDIGAWDGFYSFEAERRGAARVVALDHYIWSVDWDALGRYGEECRARGVVPEPYQNVPSVWRPAELPGKRGFDTAHRALRSNVQSVVADFMTTDLDELGAFDVVLYLGVLYHMQNPFEALRRVAAVTREVAILETEAAAFGGFEHHALCEFFESNELNNDVTNWWAPNEKALTGLCRAAGFRRVEVLVGPPALRTGKVHRYRAVAHAWK
jgi:tRNA (mo5U34)-methyltransferase